MKLAVVTGIARYTGIGHAICDNFLAEGLSVIGLDINPLDTLSFLPSKYPNRFRSRVCRVDADPSTLNQYLRSAMNELGCNYIDVVVNNAGIANPYMPGDGTCTISSEDTLMRRLNERIELYDNYIQNNLRSAFLVTEVCKKYFPPPNIGATPSIKLPNASIIHISSTRAKASEHGLSHSQEGYASAKAGLIGLTHAQGQSMSGIARVNVILPGWISTDNDYVPSEEDHKWHSSGRVGNPKDVAEMVAFLADNEKSGFVTCQEFTVDGGVTKRMYYP